jgi:hypothetical protein
MTNPNKFDEIDSDFMLDQVESSYYTCEETNSLLNNAGTNSLAVMHFNVRSLPKNLELLHDILASFKRKPDIIAVTETRLNDNTVCNVDITGYNFFNVNSPTSAGGVGIYIANNLKTTIRPDIVINCEQVESCWIEIDAGPNKKRYIIGCIYRHPHSKIAAFTEKLDELLGQFNQNKYQVFILGDMNIDFIKFNDNQQTERHLNMLYANNFLPIITKPTRITDYTKTLIDHIYTNAPIDQILSGIGLMDISDHLPIFCIVSTGIKRVKAKKLYRDYSTFNNELYIEDINGVDWNGLMDEDKCLNEITNSVINTINQIVNKHAPCKVASQSLRKQLDKPWITKGILKSIKIKQKMFYTHFHSNKISKVSQYKLYANKLNYITMLSKRQYYLNNFDKCKNNLKTTWKLIGILIKRKTKSQPYPSKLVINNKVYTEEIDIANQFNQHFVNVGPHLACKIENINESPIKYIRNSPSSSFVLSPVRASKVSELFSNLNTNKASINIPNTLIKIVAKQLSIPFTYIYNKSFETGIVPDVLKISRIIYSYL